MKFTLSLLVASLLSATALAQSASGRGAGLQVTPWDSQGTPLLQSFYFRFLNGDHHLKQVAVYAHTPFRDELTVSFSDNDANDEYVYRTRHHALVDDGIFESTAWSRICRKSCTQAIPRPSNHEDYVFVITGFHFHYDVPEGTVIYDSSDHHVDQFQVTESNGLLTVAMNDKNNDDLFSWSVQYAYVPQRLLMNVGEVSGVAGNAGVRRSGLGVGPMVIRGFDLDFRRSDRHIEVFSIRASSGGISIDYGDESRNDDYAYLVQYAFIRPQLWSRPVGVLRSNP